MNSLEQYHTTQPIPEENPSRIAEFAKRALAIATLGAAAIGAASGLVYHQNYIPESTPSVTTESDPDIAALKGLGHEVVSFDYEDTNGFDVRVYCTTEEQDPYLNLTFEGVIDESIKQTRTTLPKEAVEMVSRIVNKTPSAGATNLKFCDGKTIGWRF